MGGRRGEEGFREGGGPAFALRGPTYTPLSRGLPENSLGGLPENSPVGPVPWRGLPENSPVGPVS